MVGGIIPRALIQWIQNLPEWVMYTAMGSFILLVLVVMWLLIRKVSSQAETQTRPKAQKTTPKPLAATAPIPAPKPAPSPVLTPPPAAPVQPQITSVSTSEPKTPSQPIPKPVLKPQPQPAAAAASPTPIEPPSACSMENLPVFDSAIYNKIASLSGNNRSILFAGAGLEYLPVTIPVQTAAKLAGAGKKVLIIDLDMKRNAVAKVFDPDQNAIKNCPRPRLLPSPIENLSFWPAEFFVRFGQMNLRSVMQAGWSQFEIIFINAPYLDGHPDRNLIASSAKYGLIFCQTKQQFERLQALMAAGGCQLLESKPVSC
jgi:hypothetical protein